MFAPKGLFDDEGDREDVQSTPVKERNNEESFSAGLGHNLSSPIGDDIYSSQTANASASASPAARKAKMQEMRQAHLQKKKTKTLSSGMVRSQAEKGPGSPTSASKDMSFRMSSTEVKDVKSPSEKESKPSSSQFSRTRKSSSNLNSENGSANESNGSTDKQQPSIKDLLAEKEREKDMKKVSQVEQQMAAAGIAPVFDPVKRTEKNVKLDLSDMRSFLTTPVPKGYTLQCYIVRNKKGLKNKMYPTYELYMEEEDRFLLASKKRSKNKTSNYIISMDAKNLAKESASYLGKLRSNFVGTEFVIYDKGINPKEVDDESASISLMTVRQELGVVLYESNILGSRGPRKMVAIVPSVRKDGTRAVFRPVTDKDGILAKYKSDNGQDMTVLSNKPPKWNDQVGAYVLNFQGRVTMASVKNFQLVSQEDAETVILQFGRVGKDTFTMDLQNPLSPLQAYAICLSSFDYKFACE
jgi:tubby-related protein 1